MKEESRHDQRRNRVTKNKRQQRVKQRKTRKTRRLNQRTSHTVEPEETKGEKRGGKAQGKEEEREGKEKGKEAGTETGWRRTPEVEGAEEKSKGPKPKDECTSEAPTREGRDGITVPTNEHK